MANHNDYAEYKNNAVMQGALQQVANWKPAEYNTYTKMSDDFETRIEPPKDIPPDNVNRPQHYNSGKVECIDAIESAVVNKQGFEATCVANVIKYLWRYEQKNGVEDVKKAQWYLNKLIDTLENRD